MALPRSVAAEFPPAVSRSATPGWRWATVLGSALLAVTLPPIALAALRVPVGFVFSGYVVIARDAYVYQAIWREGWHGAWLFHSPYTGESLPGVLLYAWYLWPGHLLGWIPGPWLYHLERLLAAGALLACLWLLTGEVFRARLLRRWAMILCSLGGGVGIFVPEGLRLGPLLLQATEMRSPGSSVADLIAMAPHLPWAMALICWTMVVALRQRHRLNPSEIITGLGAVLGLELIYPQLSLLAVLVIGGWALLTRAHRPLWFAAAATGVQLPYLGYLAWTVRSTPVALSVIRPSLDVGDPVGFLLLSHLVASGLIAVAVWRGHLRGERLLPALWIVGMTIFMFAPGISHTLGRTFMASSIPFGLCATPGLLSVVRLLRGARGRRRLALALLSASSLYGVFSLAQPYWIAALRLDARAEYQSVAEAALLQRLAPHAAPDDIVLTTYLDGIFVPAQTDARAFAGHPEMTINAGRKAGQALAFFATWDRPQRAAFLRDNRISYVLATNRGAVDKLAGDPDLTLIDREGEAALYAVRR